MIQRISAAEIFDRLRLGDHLGAILDASGRAKGPEFYNLTILPLRKISAARPFNLSNLPEPFLLSVPQFIARDRRAFRQDAYLGPRDLHVCSPAQAAVRWITMARLFSRRQSL